MDTASIAIIGLSVMGSNLARNLAGKGIRVIGFDYWPEQVDRFRETAGREGIRLAESLAGLVEALQPPRKVMLMIKAGEPVDEMIRQLVPLLSRGDVIIDGGNSNFSDTTRRMREVEAQGLLYIGTGISGGEEGALRGPSIMPGGSREAWPLVRPLFEAIAAKAPDGLPCCRWIGEEGAGHFVKMVHNGIEYGDMQLICEAYHIMHELYGMTASEMAEVFTTWNQGDLNSYLIEITADILRHHETDGTPLVNRILDAAGQKGTGTWTVQTALSLGVPLTLIGEAVFARSLSAMKEERVEAAKIYTLRSSRTGTINKNQREDAVAEIGKALFAAKIVSYAQGYMLMREAATSYEWNFDYGGIAQIWRGGCIIRSNFLDRIYEAFTRRPDLPNLLIDKYFKDKIQALEQAWRQVTSRAVLHGIPIPALSAALSFLDGYRSARLPANLLQAQRDYFGAHTYERTDRARGEFFHTEWKQDCDPKAKHK
ncbi:MAG: decarboxylating NADP(+)-dependent phosphogluconate dehydrogenase [Bacteroidales bacterium]|nr:decarboxylating NADP(+)-dependent phosphogluconate dehydrogenase [Bacteroidales bacterium]